LTKATQNVLLGWGNMGTDFAVAMEASPWCAFYCKAVTVEFATVCLQWSTSVRRFCIAALL